MNFLQKSLDQAPKTWLAIGVLIALVAPLIYWLNGHEGQTGFVLGIGIGIMYSALHSMFKWKI